MKILNRPMFRYGGPIKEGIMDGIKEPRQRYAQAGDVFKQIAEGYQTGPQVSEPLRSNQQPRGDVLQSAAELGIANPYKDNSKMYMPFAKKYVTKPTYIAPEKTQDDMLFEEVENSGVQGEGLNEKTIAKLKANIFNMPEDLKQIQAREKIAKERDAGFLPTPRFNSDQGATTIDEVIENKGGTENPEDKRKKSINGILEKLGYARSQKNALYDALIKGGQRISREGLGKEGLVADLIQDTSTSYDKPEKIREAAELMQIQQDLKLEQITASKTGGATQQTYDFFIDQGMDKETALRKVQKLPNTVSEMSATAVANKFTGDGITNNVAQQMEEKGDIFKVNKFQGIINPKNYDTVSEFAKSKDFNGAGAYTVKGKIIELDDEGTIIFEQIITDSKANQKWWNPLD